MQTTVQKPQTQSNIIHITQESRIPLIGHIAFGIVIRPNSNLIQVRPTTICNMNCGFCSTDGGAFSKTHQRHFIVDPDYLVKWIKEVVEFKGPTHINIDSVGEPTTYQHLEYLISEIKKLDNITFISMQTNGTLLNKERIKKLEEAGLNRIHLSVHSLSLILSKKLFGMESYNINNILDTIKAIRESEIELLFAPVLLPGVNDKDIIDLIKFAKEINCKIAIQKYEIYTYSRKMKEAKKISYYKFYESLKKWEKEFNIKLTYDAEDLQVLRGRNLPLEFDLNEKVNVIVKAPGWMKNQMIAVARNRCITVNNCNKNIDDKVNIRITDNKNNIYIAEQI